MRLVDDDGVRRQRAAIVGLPVSVCKPAPTVEQNAPTMMTHLLGHASTATTNCLLMLSPNLSRSNAPCVHAAKKTTFDRSIADTRADRTECDCRRVIQINDVVRIAAIVPRGMLRLGSRRSPLRFEPAMMPRMQRVSR